MRAQPMGADIKICGGLFLITLHSPAVHLLIGYGFLWLRPVFVDEPMSDSKPKPASQELL